MAYQQHIDACFGAHGADRAAFETALASTGDALARLRDHAGAKSLALLELPGRDTDLAPAAAIAAEFRQRLKTILVLGTGGSSLGGQTLCALAGPASDGPNIRFLDNVDPASFAGLKATHDPADTGLLVISKSGGTVETLTQLATLLPWLQEAKGAAAADMVAVTDPTDSPLARIAKGLGARTLEHDPDIGGRFSALTIVGLLPAMIAGLDPASVRAGAAATLEKTLDAATPGEAPPAVGAALAVTLAPTAPIVVMMPYLDRLVLFAEWYRQLWAESLGKKGRGTTPLRALGTVDQHSQLQLYLDGPADKYFTVLAADTAGTGDRVDDAILDLAGDLGYLRGRRMGDVLAAEQEATIDALAAAGRPVRVLRLGLNEDTDAGRDEYVVGGLMMHFMLETIIAADLLDVNPFDQPAVEASKVAARRALAGDKS